MAEDKKKPAPAPQRVKPTFLEEHVITRGQGGSLDHKVEKRSSNK